MDIRENAQEILNHIDKAIGGKGLSFDESNVVSFVVEKDVICTFFVSEEDSALLVTIYMGPIDKSNTELPYEMLCGNYMGSYTGGGTLSIDPEENLVALFQFFPLPVENPAWIEEPLENLINAALYWRDRMGQFQPEDGQGDSNNPLFRV
ncbi:MAG: type III secretion system chaperone [Thermodesulforhabdaceae bacterium]